MTKRPATPGDDACPTGKAPAEGSATPRPRLGLGRVVVIPPGEARRQRLRRGNWRMVEPVSIKPLARPKGLRSGVAGAMAASQATVAEAPVSNDPLTPAEEMVADYIALHGRVGEEAIGREFRLKPEELRTTLRRLNVHRLLLRGEGDLWVPAPDLRVDGAAGIVNSYVDPLLHKMTSAPGRALWVATLARLAINGIKSGHYHATKAALSLQAPSGRSVVFAPQRKGMKITVSGVSPLTLAMALEPVAPHGPVTGKAGKQGEPLAETLIAGESFDPKALASALASVLTGIG